MSKFILRLYSSGIIDTIIAFVSLIIAFLTLKSTTKIKEVIDDAMTKEQYTNNRPKILELLKQCRKIVDDGQERPATNVEFNDKISQILSSMERYFSLNEDSKDSKKFFAIKREIEEHLSKKIVEDPNLDIFIMKSTYGNLLGRLTELNDNGRI